MDAPHDDIVALVQPMCNTSGERGGSFLPSRAMTAPVHYVLRVGEDAEGTAWWASAIRALASAPPPVRALLSGRSRVEVSAEEASEVLAWASSLDGWDDSGITPLAAYPAAGAEGGAAAL